MDLPSTDDLQRIAQVEALARNPTLTQAEVTRQGSDLDILLAGGVAASAEVAGQLARVEASLFLDSARGASLDRLVFDRYGLLRKPASAAFGTASFSTTAANPAPFTIPRGTTLQTADGNVWLTLAAVTFPVASTGPVTVSARSSLAGALQQIMAGTLTSITSAITGAAADLAATNPLASFGAADAEDDSGLRARARAFFTTAPRATLAAIQVAALGVPGVQSATAIEVTDPAGYPARYVDLIVADAFTEALIDVVAVPPAYAAQAAALSVTIAAALDDVRACGIPVVVTVASVVLQDVTLALSYRAGADTVVVANAARAAVVAVVNGLVPGASLLLAALRAALAGVSGLASSTILAPFGDVVPGTQQVLRSAMSRVAVVGT